MEKVSIIVPVYNMEPFVAQGLSCLTGQTYENLEIIVVDDGSTDKSFSAAKKMQEADGRIKLFRQEILALHTPPAPMSILPTLTTPLFPAPLKLW